MAKTRRDLSESLESYAARIGATPDAARLDWRGGGLCRLGLHRSAAVEDGFRIAPGTSVPTRDAALSSGWQ